MFVVLVNHNCKPNRIDEAIDRIDRNGDQMAKVAGFLYRHRTANKFKEHNILTITGWADEAAYERWLEVRKTLRAPQGESPYIDAVSECYHVMRSHEAA